MELVGRRAEREAVEHLLAEAQAGRSGALVVRGEAGIGKSAVLEHARRAATSSRFRVESSVGAESETQFAFAGLHQLCAPMLDRAGVLPEPQQAALGVAFGLRTGAAPDRFLVGLAVLNLLAEVAEDGPLLCVADDVQWLDEASAQVLAFVARRVSAERMALVYAVRDPTEADLRPFAGLPELHLRGLGDAHAQQLLAATVLAPLDATVRDRIIAEARGNPLALMELHRGTTPGQLAGGFEVPAPDSVPHRIEETFRRRSRDLPVETQLLLVVAAAEPTGDVELLWRAASELGIARDAVAPAETSGLVAIDTRVRFRHPLARSAIYGAATPPDRRRAHRALAEATEAHIDPDRHAWHRAQATQGTDEDVAARLERSADRARARGGLAAAGAFLRRAADLTPDPAVRARRALEAAHATHEGGESAAALDLLTIATVGPLDQRQLAHVGQLRAWIAFHLTRGGDAPERLLEAAATLAPLDAEQSRETYLLALDAASIVGGLDHVCVVLAAAEESGVVPPRSASPGAADLLLDGLLTAYLHGYEAGVPGLRRALLAFRDQASAAERTGDVVPDERWLWLASRLALALFDDDLVDVLGSHNVRLAREAGALMRLPAALVFQSYGLLLAGELAHAAELATEAAALAEATGATPWRWASPVLSAWRGEREETTELTTSILEEATEYGEIQMARYALAVLHNGLGSYPVASDAAARACEGGELVITSIALPELVEAAARAGHAERATAAAEQLGSWAAASGTEWGAGLAARARALTSTGADAEKLYLEAIERLQGCRMAAYLARTHLVYGEWLRREGRRSDAREQLRTAHRMLSGMGVDAFAQRAARELRATGENPRKRNSGPTDALTAQEQHIARLVATGATSREVAAQLFLSPRTVEAHLRNIFRKLDISSRRQLKDVPLP